jgi:hypothetical protein
MLMVTNRGCKRGKEIVSLGWDKFINTSTGELFEELLVKEARPL